MPTSLTPEQLTGLDASHLQLLEDGHRLVPEVAAAFAALRRDAARAGFTLTIASSFRSFERQLSIWNGKASGERPLHDDRGEPLCAAQLTPDQRLRALLRFSAIPGTSRHHWGTDLDVFDAGALSAGQTVQLTPAEVAPEGPFAPLHAWLDEQMAAGRSHGFFRPYAQERGGVAPERWHLSYAPLSLDCAAGCSADRLRAAWDRAGEQGGLALRAQIEADWPAIFARYVNVPVGWAAQAQG
ncbi:MAG: M15 family metallopeptidase [Halioglobus sp.]